MWRMMSSGFQLGDPEVLFGYAELGSPVAAPPLFPA